MRPVDKGDAPYDKISKYQEAEPYLEKRIGAYCSFCEMRVNNALAVEHKESKNSGGALMDWSNLLLSCVYCNSRKLEKIRKGDLDKWLWITNPRVQMGKDVKISAGSTVFMY